MFITVLPRNGAPIVRDDVAAGIEDFSLFVIPAEAFGNDLDPDGDVIFFQQTELLGELLNFLSPDFTVEALSANNQALPDWLLFDADTMTFVGDVPEGLTEPVEVAVFLRDPSNDATIRSASLSILPIAMMWTIWPAACRLKTMCWRASSFANPSPPTANLAQMTLAMTLRPRHLGGRQRSARMAELRCCDADFTGTPPVDVTENFDASITFAWRHDAGDTETLAETC